VPNAFGVLAVIGVPGVDGALGITGVFDVVGIPDLFPLCGVVFCPVILSILPFNHCLNYKKMQHLSKQFHPLFYQSQNIDIEAMTSS
jgi:hypothetical protein